MSAWNSAEGQTRRRRHSPPELPSEIEELPRRALAARRHASGRSALDAEHFIEQVGFTACLTDCRRPGPSLYVAVCGRRDAVMPRNVQTDHEASLTWVLKDEVMRRGKVYYAKLARGKATFLAPRMIPYFHAIWGLRRSEEARRLEQERASHSSACCARSGKWGRPICARNRACAIAPAFTKALDELQAAMVVVPSEVLYQPKFTYIWTLGVGRFPDALRKRVSRDTALREIARCFLAGAGSPCPASWRASPACHARRPAAAIARWWPKATRRCSRPGVIVWRLTHVPVADVLRLTWFCNLAVQTLNPNPRNPGTLGTPEPPMKSYVITTGTVFGLLTLAHVWRGVEEPHLAKDLAFVVGTILAAALCAWSLRVLRQISRKTASGDAGRLKE